MTRGGKARKRRSGNAKLSDVALAACPANPPLNPPSRPHYKSGVCHRNAQPMRPKPSNAAPLCSPVSHLARREHLPNAPIAMHRSTSPIVPLWFTGEPGQALNARFLRHLQAICRAPQPAHQVPPIVEMTAEGCQRLSKRSTIGIETSSSTLFCQSSPSGSYLNRMPKKSFGIPMNVVSSSITGMTASSSTRG